jgi:hypothetical protein
MESAQFFIRTFLKVAVILIPMVYYIWFKNNHIIVVVTFVLFFFIVEYFAVFKPVKNIDDKKKEILNFFIKNWIDGARYNGKKPKIRINIMLKKFRFINFHLYQYYKYKMENYSDCDLHFAISKGFAGECLKKDIENAPYLFDMRNYSKEQILRFYKFNNKLYEKTKHIKAIACVPIQKKIRSIFYPGVDKYKKIGVLCVDATDEIGADFLAEKKVLQEIKYFHELVKRIYS